VNDTEPECYREPHGDTEVEDVLRYLDERKEDGASSITIASVAGCNIPLSHAVEILKNLEEQGKARRVMKGRLELWFPPLTAYTQSIEQAEDAKVHEVKEADVPGGRISCPVKGCDSKVSDSSGSKWSALRKHLKGIHELPEDVVERSISDLRDNKPVELTAEVMMAKPCQFCGQTKKNVSAHEKWCYKNPAREENIMKKRKEKYGDKAITGPLPATRIGQTGGKCQFCGKLMESRLKNHERLCKANPGRFNKPRGPVPELLISAKNDQFSNSPPEPAPTPIDDTVPPGSELMGLDKGHNDALGAYELSKPPTCATCSDSGCGDQGKDLIACDDHEPGPTVRRGRMAPVGPHYDPEQAAEDLAAMPDCESGRCTIQPDPVLDAPFAPEPRAFRESVPIAVMEGEPKPWSWPLETFHGRAATLAKDNPESEHYQRPESQEDVRAWLLRTLTQLSDDARARGFDVEVSTSWGNYSLKAHMDLKVRREVRA
jgi:hypothetical protein